MDNPKKKTANLQGLREQMESLHQCVYPDLPDRLTAQDKKLDQILDSLKGNELGMPGVIPRLDAVEKKTESLLKERLIRYSTSAGIGLGTGGLGAYLIKALFK